EAQSESEKLRKEAQIYLEQSRKSTDEEIARHRVREMETLKNDLERENNKHLAQRKSQIGELEKLIKLEVTAKIQEILPEANDQTLRSLEKDVSQIVRLVMNDE